jgi:uncharacterized membrane protein HdeD (DUF308 family)
MPTQHTGYMDLFKLPSETVYASTLAIVSGVYSILMGYVPGMPIRTLVTFLGIVVILHGILLLFPSKKINLSSQDSGFLMVLYGLLMLSDQLFSQLTSSMMIGWDAGMISLSLLMLVSGRLMLIKPHM